MENPVHACIQFEASPCRIYDEAAGVKVHNNDDEITRSWMKNFYKMLIAVSVFKDHCDQIDAVRIEFYTSTRDFMGMRGRDRQSNKVLQLKETIEHANKVATETLACE